MKFLVVFDIIPTIAPRIRVPNISFLADPNGRRIEVFIECIDNHSKCVVKRTFNK